MLQLTGVYTALVTPFRNGVVDYDRLRANVDFQFAGGVDGLVPVGTTGESPTLSHEEHRTVIEKAIEFAAGRGPIIAGTGSNATSEALSLTRHAKDVGADAALMVNPYYNKPSQEGLYRHFMTIADAVDLPIVLYNIPGRTNITMTPATVERLSRHENIVAIKEATGSLDIASEIAHRCGDRITIVSGDDSLTLPLMSVGARGVISVLSNLLPDRVKGMVDAAASGDYASAREQHLSMFPLFRAMLTLAVNPIVIKTAMQIAGRDTGELRLPLCEMDASAKSELVELVKKTLPVTAKA
jgi:4-hydroxy-tetrahydrodipicolinate synthase